jgi:hypothetical protein
MLTLAWWTQRGVQRTQPRRWPHQVVPEPPRTAAGHTSHHDSGTAATSASAAHRSPAAFAPPRTAPAGGD